VGGEEVEFYRKLLSTLQNEGKLDSGGVGYNPHESLISQGKILALVKDQESVQTAKKKDVIQVILAETPFYLEAGGQVSDTGVIAGKNWKIAIEDLYQPAAGIIVHKGTVLEGKPAVGDTAEIIVDQMRRKDIIRNHTGTHLLHAALDHILGGHARQAGSLVAPDYLRFDFTHNQALSEDEIKAVEEEVNRRILEDHVLDIKTKKLQDAIDEGARALFGEKYGDVVRTIRCGGTHCERSSEVGLFLITSESSTAAGIRRIEAVTGRKAYQLVQSRFQELKSAANYLSTSSDQVAYSTGVMFETLKSNEKIITKLQNKQALIELEQALEGIEQIEGIKLLTINVEDADLDTLRLMADRYSGSTFQKVV